MQTKVKEEAERPFATLANGAEDGAEVGVAKLLFVSYFATTSTAAPRRRAISEVGVAGFLMPSTWVATSTALGIDGVDAAELFLWSTSASAPTPPTRPTRDMGSIPGVVGVADRFMATGSATTPTPPWDTAEALPERVTAREREEMPSVADVFTFSGSAATLDIPLKRTWMDREERKEGGRHTRHFTSGLLRAPHPHARRTTSHTDTITAPVGQFTSVTTSRTTHAPISHRCRAIGHICATLAAGMAMGRVRPSRRHSISRALPHAKGVAAGREATRRWTTRPQVVLR